MASNSWFVDINTFHFYFTPFPVLPNLALTVTYLIPIQLHLPIYINAIAGLFIKYKGFPFQN